MGDKKRFAPVGEKEITRAISERFWREFHDYVDSDVVIVGAGPSGLTAGRHLADDGYKVLLVEQNNYLGGGFWLGGYLMNKLTVRAPAQRVLDEIGAPYEEVSPGLFLTDGPHACSKLIAAACDAGVKVLNLTCFEDVVLRDENRVAGVVINWAPVQALPRQITCVDPVAMESKVVIDATGHEAQVLNMLDERGLFNLPGHTGMWAERSEDLIVEKAGEVYPGVVVVGMAVATAFGLPRMGPTFGAMLVSGEEGAAAARRILQARQAAAEPAAVAAS